MRRIRDRLGDSLCGLIFSFDDTYRQIFSNFVLYELLTTRKNQKFLSVNNQSTYWKDNGCEFHRDYKEVYTRSVYRHTFFMDAPFGHRDGSVSITRYPSAVTYWESCYMSTSRFFAGDHFIRMAVQEVNYPDGGGVKSRHIHRRNDPLIEVWKYYPNGSLRAWYQLTTLWHSLAILQKKRDGLLYERRYRGWKIGMSFSFYRCKDTETTPILYERAHYVNDVLNGERLRFYRSGNVQSREMFMDGKLQSRQIFHRTRSDYVRISGGRWSVEKSIH